MLSEESNEVEETKATILKVAIDKINKSFGAGSLWSATTDIPDIETVSTGAITLDKALGVGGLPKGRITEIFGPEQVGKSTLALSVIANVQREAGNAALIDVEHAIDLSYAKSLGVDVTKLIISQPDTAEQALEIAETLVRAGIDCIVLDSVAMLVTEAEIQGEMTDMQIGAQARLMGKALRKLMAPINKGNCVFILINQLREKIGGYGNPEITPGGRSIKYMSSVRIDLRRKEQIKDGDQVYGIRVLAKVVKNKVAPPSKQAEFDIHYGKGIHYIGSLIDAAIDAGKIVRNGAWYKVGQYSLSGRNGVIEKLTSDDTLRRELENSL